LVIVLAAATAGPVRAAQPAGSAMFQRYWSSHAVYLKRVAAVRELRARVAPARAYLVALPDDALARLAASGVPPLVAADSGFMTRDGFLTAGTDPTRYLGHYGCCRTEREAARERRDVAQRQCADLSFRTVTGHVVRSGRHVREGIWPLGIVPQGLDEYEGALVVGGTAERIPVAWERQWNLQRGDPLAEDPLDSRSHLFRLQRLRGARNWTIQRWSAQPSQPRQAPIDAANCLNRLSQGPGIGLPGPAN